MHGHSQGAACCSNRVEELIEWPGSITYARVQEHESKTQNSMQSVGVYARMRIARRHYANVRTNVRCYPSRGPQRVRRER